MKPEPGQLVKVVFRNNATCEGIVSEWSDEKSVLTSRDGDSVLIIQQTLQDVLLVKIMGKYKPVSEIVAEYEEVKETVTQKDVNTLKRLAELKNELNEVERQDFFSQLRTHHFTQIPSVQYPAGQDASIAVPEEPRIIQRPPEEDSREDVRDSSSVLKMLRRKNKTI